MAAQAPSSARYLEIEWQLREWARNGSPGMLLPSESELAAQFHVSRMTARHAVQNLAQEGLVTRRRGAGTYVAQHPFRRYEGIFLSFTEDMRRRGMTASSKILEAVVRSGTTGEIEALNLTGDQRVVCIRRIRFADDLPLCLERSVLAASCAAVLSSDLEKGSLHAAMAAIGVVPAVSESWITARMPTAAERKHLGLASPREPLLVDRRIIRDNRGAPIEATESAYLANRYEIDVIFKVPGQSAKTS